MLLFALVFFKLYRKKTVNIFVCSFILSNVTNLKSIQYYLYMAGYVYVGSIIYKNGEVNDDVSHYTRESSAKIMYSDSECHNPQNYISLNRESVN